MVLWSVGTQLRLYLQFGTKGPLRNLEYVIILLYSFSTTKQRHWHFYQKIITIMCKIGKTFEQPELIFWKTRNRATQNFVWNHIKFFGSKPVLWIGLSSELSVLRNWGILDGFIANSLVLVFKNWKGILRDSSSNDRPHKTYK